MPIRGLTRQITLLSPSINIKYLLLYWLFSSDEICFYIETMIVSNKFCPSLVILLDHLKKKGVV